MKILRVHIWFCAALLWSCGENVSSDSVLVPCVEVESGEVFSEPARPAVRGALVSTRFQSFEALKEVVQIEYSGLKNGKGEASGVRLTHCSNGNQVTSILKKGVSEKAFVAARDGGFRERISLLFASPYAVIHRNKLKGLFFLSRRRHLIFGEGDPAFYDISAEIMGNIFYQDSMVLDSVDLHSEKGYFNTVNHITAQVFVTSIFSEKLADFIADSHERKNMPELVTGNFSSEQIADLGTGPVDNYVDMINNEWGQELGKRLKKKYEIDKNTFWTPELLATFLNEIQSYYGWSFQIAFHPFRAEEEVIIRFASKINKILSGESG